MAFRNRLCLVTDIEGFGGRTAPERADAARRLFHVQQFALSQVRAFRVQPAMREDRGDGQLMLLPLTLDPTKAVPGLVAGFRHALHVDNEQAGLSRRLRVRISLARGAVTLRGPLGAEGDCLITACRLNDAYILKQALRDHEEADLAVIITDDLFQDVVRHDYGSLRSAEFTKVDVEVKEHASIAWIHVPPSSRVAGMPNATATWKVATTSVAVAGLTVFAATSQFPTFPADVAGEQVPAHTGPVAHYPAMPDHSELQNYPDYPDGSGYPDVDHHLLSGMDPGNLPAHLQSLIDAHAFQQPSYAHLGNLPPDDLGSPGVDGGW